jgi:pimeloyl-ACP methyl ester carboxylesterase
MMQPTFFGDSLRPLFGVLHAPTGTPRDTGVVVFCPGIQEYGSAHWALRSLASALAARGFHTLRFDYRGTGDSTGEPEESTIDAWTDDARLAYDEIRDAAGVQCVSFIGLRLGAMVALLASAAGAAVEDLFLWDPVVSGASYLEEIELLDATTRLRRMYPLKSSPGEGLGGYHFPHVVRESIARVDARELGAPRARRIAIFVPRATSEVSSLIEVLERRGTAVEVHVSGGGDGAVQAGARQAAMLATEVIRAIVGRMEARGP